MNLGSRKSEVNLEYCNHSTILKWCCKRMSACPCALSFTSRCQNTCSSTHQTIPEPAIIFLQALSWPQAYSTGSPLYHTPSSSSSRQHHRAAFLAADNKRGAEWTLQSSLQAAERRGSYTQQRQDRRVSRNQGSTRCWVYQSLCLHG